MIHNRHFTREDAQALLPVLGPLLEELRLAKEALTDAEAHSLLADASAGNGGGPQGQRIGEAFLGVRGLLARLTDHGVVVRDIDNGLIDFPAIIDGREAYLCWRLGEPAIDHWHGVDDGFAGRRPLD